MLACQCAQMSTSANLTGFVTNLCSVEVDCVGNLNNSGIVKLNMSHVE